MTARVTSHTLNAVDGSHAGSIAVTLTDLSTGQMVFAGETDSGGRLAIDVAAPDPDATYELVFHAGAYWQDRPTGDHGTRIMDQVVLRFSMPDPQGRYHMPVILSPHGYSVWSSTEHG